MKQFLKWIGIGVGGLVGLLVLVAGALTALGSSKINRTYAVEPLPVAVSTNTAVLHRGEYLASVGCAGCHGDDMGGAAFFEDPALGSIPAPNLTRGQGGAAAVYSDVDFVRAIRHGIDRHGKSLLVMPSAAYWHYSDADLAAIIAYLQSTAPVDKNVGERQLGPLGRMLVGAGMLDVLAAEHVDHEAARPVTPMQAVSAEYGAYIANTNDCRNCHGPDLAGGRSPEPGAPLAPGLTPGGDLAGWTAEDFITTMRSGVTPTGLTLNPAFMPWEDYARMSDEDLTALFLYLESLPLTTAAEE